MVCYRNSRAAWSTTFTWGCCAGADWSYCSSKHGDFVIDFLAPRALFWVASKRELMEFLLGHLGQVKCTMKKIQELEDDEYDDEDEPMRGFQVLAPHYLRIHLILLFCRVCFSISADDLHNRKRLARWKRHLAGDGAKLGRFVPKTFGSCEIWLICVSQIVGSIWRESWIRCCHNCNDYRVSFDHRGLCLHTALSILETYDCLDSAWGRVAWRRDQKNSRIQTTRLFRGRNPKPVWPSRRNDHSQAWITASVMHTHILPQSHH